jgi:dual oxidase
MVTFGILLLRWHNVVAARVQRQHPDWSDEQLFQRARRIVIASLQVIFLYQMPLHSIIILVYFIVAIVRYSE